LSNANLCHAAGHAEGRTEGETERLMLNAAFEKEKLEGEALNTGIAELKRLLLKCTLFN
jgi:hypothetical protein